MRAGGREPRCAIAREKNSPPDWIGSQIHYFSRHQPVRECWAKIAETMSWFLFLTAGALTLAIPLFLYLRTRSEGFPNGAALARIAQSGCGLGVFALRHFPNGLGQLWQSNNENRNHNGFCDIGGSGFDDLRELPGRTRRSLLSRMPFWRVRDFSFGSVGTNNFHYGICDDRHRRVVERPGGRMALSFGTTGLGGRSAQFPRHA